MFILDSLFISGLRWVLGNVVTAVDAEMNDDTALREELLAAELRREMGEISDEEFADIESDLLARIREIKERREGGSGPIAIGGPMETTDDTRLEVEATVSGEFHDHETGGPGRSGDAPASKSFEGSRPTRTAGSAEGSRTRTTRTSRTSRTPRRIRG